MAGAGYDIGASASSSATSAAANSGAFYNTGGGGGLQIFGLGSQTSGVNQLLNPKVVEYVAVALAGLGVIVLLFVLFKK